MDAFFGEIRMIPIPNMRIPADWHVCDGSLLQISAYNALYSLIGTQYGGDGVSTFALPDLRGRTPVSQGLAKSGTQYTIATKGGAEVVAVTDEQLPPHTHAMTVSTAAAATQAPNNNYLAAPNDPTYNQAIGMYVATTATGYKVLAQNTNMIGQTGGGDPHMNLQPLQVINYMICVNNGIYPNFN